MSLLDSMVFILCAFLSTIAGFANGYAKGFEKATKVASTCGWLEHEKQWYRVIKDQEPK